MLTMDDIKYIKRMHECEGVSIREIMRRTGYHYETIKKYLDLNDFNESSPPPRVLPSLLDPLKPVVDQWLTDDLKAPRKQRHTAKRVYERLQEEYPDLVEVKLRTVQYYVSQKKKELYQSQQKAYLPLYHPPGEAQADFGHFSYYDNLGELVDALKLTLSFPYSNQSYCQIFGGENQECLLQGMKNIFEYIGAVPARIVFDNLSTAVAHMGSGHDRIMTEKFKRFSVHYGFEPFFCNGGAGWEKGNVENKVGYERRNLFVPVPTILDFEQFNQSLFQSCDKDAQRSHYVKEELICQLFSEEKKDMLPLNPIPFEVFSFGSRIADKYGKVSFDSNQYSSSPSYAKNTVYVKATSDRILLLNESYELIMEHQRLYGKGKESMKWLPYIELMAKRPTALKYTAFYDELPDNWRKYLNSQDTEGKRKGLNSLSIMLKKHDMRTAADALAFSISNGVKDADSILASYRRLTAEVQHMQPLQIANTVIQMPTFRTDNDRYDDLFRKEANS